ncbi:Proton/glutamate-aspartate symporter [BD1-7 clade bacterium]|uniref:Proton/glutamate-aspartate symporter n=1 Tax=BD1-7 clade bacterium TaxID=2029982 RepID=A0A5S9QEG1_9GAMM|nr:Proton/glutamate-aspartate symporter [BD1-7 clade bacterium]
MSKLALHWQILIAILLAVAVGVLFEPSTLLFGVSLDTIFDFFGTLFLNALKMLIVPLVVSSIICGISGIGDGGNIGRVGGKTIGFYMASSLLAILVGLLFVNILQPGIHNGQPVGQTLNLTMVGDQLEQQLSRVEGRDVGDVVDVFLRMVPPNIIAAAESGQMLGLISFSMLFGFFMMRVESPYREAVSNFFNGMFEIMMHMTMFVMKFAPIGVFALVAKTVLSAGVGVFGPLLIFFITVVLALAFHVFINLALIMRYVAKINPIKHYRIMSPVMLTAFSTASSSATLPMTMETIEQDGGVSNKTTSFVLPLGATINMDGTALYECVAAMFIAQAYGLDIGFAEQFLIVTIALLTSIGVAGIPAASLVAISVILTAIGLPLEGIGLLLVTDRILDMLRTAVNVFSDSVCAVFVARSEGEETKLV